MSQAFYRKWRPIHWDEIVGQHHIVQTLTNAVHADRVGHAYLFAGPRGTGKTSIARILAKAVNCLNEDLNERPCNACEHCLAVNENRFLDLIEIDAASNTSVDDVRDLRDKINFSPSQGDFKIYIIDEVHMLSTAAFNALLKTLEEPPPHAIFVLATTEIHKIPATVLSRCQRHEFRRLPIDEIVGQLKHISADENIEVDDDAMLLIARQSAGGLRDAISLLDQLSSIGQKIDISLVQTVLGTATTQTVLDLITAILNQKPAHAMDTIHQALDAGADSRSLSRQIVDYLRNLMLIQMGNDDQIDITQNVKKVMSEHAGAFTTQDILFMMRVFNTAAINTLGGWQPSLSLELAVAESIEKVADQPVVEPIREPASEYQTKPPKKKPITKKNTTKNTEAKYSPETPVINLADVIEAWREIRSNIKPDHPGIEALLNSSKPLEIRGKQLYLGFQSETVRELMDIDHKIETAQAAIKKVLAVDLSIKCVVTTAKGTLPPDVNPNGMVATAIQNGGEIVDSSD